MDQQPSSDRRRFQRFPFDGDILLRHPDGRTVETRLIDLSLQGACLVQPEEDSPVPGDLVDITLALSDEIRIHMTAEVMHRDQGTLGCACRFIDVHSMAALRRMVELNLGNPALLERELSALMAQ